MILVIEDNKDVNDLLRETLVEAGYEAESAYTGIDGMKMLHKKEYALVLLDLMLPYKSGDQILKELRTFSDAIVIIISAKDMVGTKVDLLRMGADDYITKPFDLDEVLARVESNLRRQERKQKQNKKYEHKNLVLDATSKRVWLNEQEVDLTAKEYSILEIMMEYPNKVFTKASIYETIWGEEYYGDDNTVKTHLSNLRSKIAHYDGEQEYIETVRGIGYRLKQ
ncbi:response regulator transcription factor [Anaerosporobacter faecicola]|uniref:response regulator transcription factor n=1 Tax=Anaerosporobacter faecicola TaxID=2718714 RepID=UPI00143A0E21|nr:response regulator transcription factor [Anaerosporobacter faecicola]